MKHPEPKIPQHLDPLAMEMLEKLREYPEAARHVVLGGYFALKHYLDYRNTSDIDGWWSRDTPLTDKSPWSPIPIEELEDNIAAKMNALVSRGAPRDFQDIRRRRYRTGIVTWISI